MVKNPPANAGDIKDVGLLPGSGRSPGGGASSMAPTPVFLPGESHGQRSLVGYRPWSCKSDTTEVTQHMKLKTKNLSVILVVATFYSLIAQTVKNLPAMQVIRVQSLGQEDLLEKGRATLCPGKSHGQGNLEGYSPWVLKESDTT